MVYDEKENLVHINFKDVLTDYEKEYIPTVKEQYERAKMRLSLYFKVKNVGMGFNIYVLNNSSLSFQDNFEAWLNKILDQIQTYQCDFHRLD